jgi:mono/diheme cytochrome c family protein
VKVAGADEGRPAADQASDRREGRRHGRGREARRRERGRDRGGREAPGREDAGDAKPAAETKTETKTDAKPPTPKVAAIDGKPLYEAKCKSCHAIDGKGTEAMKKNNIPDLTDKADWQGKHSKAKIVAAVTDGIEGTKMKAFKDKLKPEEIEAIAVYVKKLK